MSEAFDKLASQIAEIGQKAEQSKAAVDTDKDVVKPISESIDSQVQQESTTQEREFSEIEKKAFEMGWRPQDEYSGENFVDAREYVNRAPLFARIDNQKKEIQELRDMMKRTTDHLAQTTKLAYEKALADLESKREKAVENGDRTTFNQTEAQVNDLRVRMQHDPILNQPAIPQQIEASQPHPEALAFAKRNEAWFNKNTPENERMLEAAELIDKQLYREAQRQGRPIDTKEHLSTIEKEIKRIFPNKFPKSDTVIAPTVGRSTASRETNQQSNLVSKLTPQQLELGRYLEKNSYDAKTKKSKYTLEMYAKDIAEQQSRGQIDVK